MIYIVTESYKIILHSLYILQGKKTMTYIFIFGRTIKKTYMIFTEKSICAPLLPGFNLLYKIYLSFKVNIHIKKY